MHSWAIMGCFLLLLWKDRVWLIICQFDFESLAVSRHLSLSSNHLPAQFRLSGIDHMNYVHATLMSSWFQSVSILLYVYEYSEWNSSDSLLHNSPIKAFENKQASSLDLQLWSLPRESKRAKLNTFSVCCRVYCKGGILSQIPKGKAADKQTGKSTERHLTETIPQCCSCLQWPYCGLL